MGGKTMTLDELHIGDSAVIVSVGGEGALRRRLLDMGLTPKTNVSIRKMAPMGDPIELHLRGYELTLRAEDARKIEIVQKDARETDKPQEPFRQERKKIKANWQWKADGRQTEGK